MFINESGAKCEKHNAHEFKNDYCNLLTIIPFKIHTERQAS